MKVFTCVLVYLTLLALPAYGAVRFVPMNYSTIQAAINASSNGDIVVVANGTYTGSSNKNLDFNGKAIRVESSGGYLNCTINCGGSGRAFYFHNGETTSSIVDGFTIKSGFIDEPGAGIYCDGASPAIRDCRFESNVVMDWGGGGIACEGASNPAISNCEFYNNQGNAYGGAISCSDSSSPNILYCNFESNDAFDVDSSAGGAIFCDGYASPVIYKCTFYDNTAGLVGGAIHFSDYAEANLISCVLSGNSAYKGGAVSVHRCDPIIMNCLFYDNSADTYGGAFYIRYSSADVNLKNCTLEGNSASDGDGIYCDAGDVVIINGILWDNGTEEIETVNSGSSTVTYSDIDGGHAGTGNINSNPKFKANCCEDYGLWNGLNPSPCINAGSANAATINVYSLIYMDNLTTNCNSVDSDTVDMGYHCDLE